jgi:hypothetical protein
VIHTDISQKLKLELRRMIAIGIVLAGFTLWSCQGMINDFERMRHERAEMEIKKHELELKIKGCRP